MAKKKYSIKQIKEAIQKLEENDEYYNFAQGFEGVEILDAYIDEDDLEENPDNPTIYYSARVYWDNKREEFDECCCTMYDLKNFLPKLS